MARKAREKERFGTYYITQTSTPTKKLFENTKDKNKFLEIIAKAKKKFDFKLYAYCLNSNSEYKLIIYDNGNDISKIMRSINISYSMYAKCDGKLFKDRYKSILIKNYYELLEFTKEIHCNYSKWNSYCEYINKNSKPNSLLDTETILNIFTFNDLDPKKNYKNYLKNNVEVNKICDNNISFCNDKKKCITSLKEGKEYIDSFAKKNNLTTNMLFKNKKLRNSILKYLRKNSTLSLKELGYLFDLTESSVCKILNK